LWPLSAFTNSKIMTKTRGAGRPGKQPKIEVIPRMGRQPPRLARFSGYLSPINDRLLILGWKSLRPRQLRGLFFGDG